ncbi:alpha/beta hydrolase [Candidatus Pelagibacter sp.]|nr:alpha/beta hydrolase [Candidatus Pelagibacter sp.]
MQKKKELNLFGYLVQKNLEEQIRLKNYQLIKDGRKNKILHKKINLQIPITMIHGSKDTTVPVSFSRKVLKLFTKAKKKLVTIKNGDHSLFNKKLQKKIIRELDLIFN